MNLGHDAIAALPLAATERDGQLAEPSRAEPALAALAVETVTVIEIDLVELATLGVGP